MKFLFNIVILILSVTSYSQKIVKTSGVGEVEYSTSISEDEAKKQAKEKATINAIENAFGIVVIDGSSTYISNNKTNEKYETKSVYNFISNQAINGEVIEVISESYKPKIKSIVSGKDSLKIRFLECQITVMAKELLSPAVQFESYSMVCDNLKCKTTDLKNNDDLFIYLKSPALGFVWIYIDDGKTTQCMLPYREMPTTYDEGFLVQPDKEYIFFANSAAKHQMHNLNFIVDTYQLTTDKAMEMNRIFILFSSTPLTKPKFDPSNEKQLLTEAELNAGYAAPKSLSSEDFQRWLIRNRSYKNTRIALQTIDITIKK